MSALSSPDPDGAESRARRAGPAGRPPPAAAGASTRRIEQESEADDLEMTSPEGRPADPGVRGKTAIVLVAIAVGVVVVAAGLIARAGSPWLALGIALAGLIFVLLFNPIVWTSVLRVREREKVHHEHEQASEGG